MKFFNIDFHISVIADIQSLLGELGHQVDSLSLSNHTWVLGRERDRVAALDGMSTTSFGQRECDRFYQMERTRLEEYDGFIVTHTPCLAGLYERTGKPVICVVSTRYNGFCHSPESQAWLEDKLRQMHASGQLILLANNAYDAWHVERNVGITPPIVPSVCDYTRVKWSGGKTEPFSAGRQEIPGLRRLSHGHGWQEVADARCVVTVPYNVSLMSVFERHAMGMPMLMPSGLWTLLHKESLEDLTCFGAPDSRELEAAVTLSDWHIEELPGITFFDRLEEIPDLLSEGIPPTHGYAERKERILGLWEEAVGRAGTRRHPVKSTPDITSGSLSGFWKWDDGFIGELRADGILVQLREANREHRLGSWAATPEGFELHLPEHWRKRIVLSTPDSGLWYLNDSTTPGGSIRKLGLSAPPPEPRRRFVNCDSYVSLADQRTFVVHTDCAELWHKHLRPPHAFTLITCHSDSPVEERHLPILNDENLVVWYAYNVKIEHPKIRPIPIGVCHRLSLDAWLAKSGRGRLTPQLYDLLLLEGADTPKSKMFHMSFNIWTNPTERNRCVMATGLPIESQSQPAFLLDLAASRFCVSPEGNGIDCLRVWEALYCRTIPIITRNPMVSMGLYDGLPVVVLDCWEDFASSDFSEERYEELIRGFDPTCITVNRWIPAASVIKVPGESKTSSIL